MKYAVITVTDGSFLVRSEQEDKDSAIKAWLGLNLALRNDDSFQKGYIEIIDENLDVTDGYKDIITHNLQPVEPSEE